MPIKLRKRKGSRNFYLRGSVRGIAVDESTGTDDKAAADAIRIKREDELLDRSVFGARATVSFLEAAVGYMETVSHNECRLVGKLLGHFKATSLGRIDQEAIDRAAALLYPNASPETLNRCIYTPMAAILHRAAKRGQCDWIRLDRPKQNKGRVRWITPEEAERLIAASRPRLRPLVTFLLYTGCRLGEALALTWDRVDLHAHHISIFESKTQTDRPVAMHSRVLVALANLPHREGYVFPWRTRGGIYKHWRLACRSAGLENFTPHDCRHTFATWLRKYSGQDLLGVMRAGGWRDYKSVLRYAHVTSEEIRSAVDKLPDGEISGKPEKTGSNNNEV